MSERRQEAVRPAGAPMVPVEPPSWASGRDDGGGAASATAERGRQAGREVAQEARAAGGEIAREFRSAGGDVANEARERARSEFDHRSSMAGDRVRGTAGDLEEIARGLREKGDDSAARIAEEAARRIERVGGYLRDADMDSVGRDVRRLSRERPMAVAAGALAIGLVAGRILTASPPETTTSGGRR